MSARVATAPAVGAKLARNALAGVIAGSMIGIPTAFSLVRAQDRDFGVEPARTMTARDEAPKDDGIIETDPADPTIGRARDGLFYVDVRMNGKPVRCLLDTGASTIVLSRAQSARLGIGRGSEAGSMITSAGRVAATRRTLDHVEIAGRQFESVPAIVVAAADTPCLLGQDVLARLDRLEIAGNELRLQ